MVDNGQATINEHKKINLGTNDDPKPTFFIPMLYDKEVAQYEQFIQEYKDIFA